MKTIVIFVTTLDGKITKWWDPHVMRWSSKEDQSYFKKIWSESPLVVMGSGTYDFDPIAPSPNTRLVIMTRSPADYEHSQVAGELEFTSETPTQLSDRFQSQYEQMLVVGGPHVATSFFTEGQVDELWLTLEPKIFGIGGNFVIEEKLDVELRQISCEKVNDRGTMITKYAVIKNTPAS